MSNATDEKMVDPEALENYLRGESSYSRAYGAVDADELPPELDRNVLAEARAALTPRKRLMWQRVGPMLAVAATAVLTISIVMRSGVENSLPKIQNVEVAEAPNLSLKNVAPPATESELKPAAEPGAPSEANTASVKLDAPPPTEVRDKQKRSSPARADERVRKPTSMEADSQREFAKPVAENNEKLAADRQASEKKESQQLASSQSAGTPAIAVPRINAPTSAPVELRKAAPTQERRVAQPSSLAAKGSRLMDLEEVVVTGSYIRGEQSRAVGPRGTIPPPNTTSLADRISEQQYRENNPLNWLEYIRNLRADGKQRDADREWDRFVKAFPTYRIEANDTARAKRSP